MTLAENEALPVVSIEPVTPEAMRLWALALSLARDLGADRQWWLRNVVRYLDFDDPALSAVFPADVLEQGRQAFELLSTS